MIFLDNFFFEKIWLIFDIQNWLWKYDFSTFWQTFITRRNFLKIFPWWHVDSWSKSLLVRTHHLWNSTTELILVCICLCFHFKYKTCCPKYFLWPEFGQKMSKSTSKQVQMHHVEVLPVFLFIHIFNMK